MTAQKAVIRIRDEILRHTRQLERIRPLSRSCWPKGAGAPCGLQSAQCRSQSNRCAIQNGIIVEGLDNCLVKFAKCCTPVPGDPVVGFITRGYGVSVHRQDCPNASPERRAKEKDRWISVSWGDTHQDAYQTSLDITAKDRQNLFLDVAAALSAAQVRVDSLSAKGTPDGFAVITAQLQVHSKDEINAVMRKLNGVNGVMTVNRAKG